MGAGGPHARRLPRRRSLCGRGGRHASGGAAPPAAAAAAAGSSTSGAGTVQGARRRLPNCAACPLALHRCTPWLAARACPPGCLTRRKSRCARTRSTGGAWSCCRFGGGRRAGRARAAAAASLPTSSQHARPSRAGFRVPRRLPAHQDYARWRVHLCLGLPPATGAQPCRGGGCWGGLRGGRTPDGNHTMRTPPASSDALL